MFTSDIMVQFITRHAAFYYHLLSLTTKHFQLGPFQHPLALKINLNSPVPTSAYYVVKNAASLFASSSPSATIILPFCRDIKVPI